MGKGNKKAKRGGNNGAKGRKTGASGKRQLDKVDGGFEWLSEGEALVDGSFGEGGGQILRATVAAAGILGCDVKVTNIRANRPRGGGLRPQHLSGILTCAALYSVHLKGAGVGSMDISFLAQSRKPASQRMHHLTADTKTAGSVCLLAQVLFPCALFQEHPIILTLKGGTNAIKAPPADYFQHVFLPFVVRHCGVSPATTCKITRRGFYPKGGGELLVNMHPLASSQTLSAFHLTDRGRLQSAHVYLFYTSDRQPDFDRACPGGGLPEHIMQLFKDQFGGEEEGGVGSDEPLLHLHVDRVDRAKDSCSGLLIVGHSSTGSIIACSRLSEGNRRTPIHEMINSAYQEFVSYYEDKWSTVDEHLQDQLVILAAFARGTSVYRSNILTLHTKTSLFMVSKITGARIKVEQRMEDNSRVPIDTQDCSGGDVRGQFEVSITGIAFQNNE